MHVVSLDLKRSDNYTCGCEMQIDKLLIGWPLGTVEFFQTVCIWKMSRHGL